MVAEQTHRYPRWITYSIEVLCAIAVSVAAFLAGRMILLYIWTSYGLDLALAPQLPWLTTVVVGLGGGVTGEKIYRLDMLLPSLAWLLLALLLTLLLRNSLPTVRTSPRGMLVEFAGGWLPIPWESLSAIKVTEDFGAERFVLLAETSKAHLTGWHRLYALLYRFSLRRGFLITSAISNFDGLVQTLLSETDRVARVLDNVHKIRLQEDASSPLFRFLLGPASFFSRRDTSDAVATPVIANSGGILRGTYPLRISALFHWGALILAVLALLRYAIYWMQFLALQFAPLRDLPLFDRLTLTVGQAAAPWWLLIAAHLMLAAMFGILIALRHLLPQLEARGEGLAVRHFNRWHLLPWADVATIKVTELSEQSQVVLVQANRGLPNSTRLASLLYDGSRKPGVLITSAISGFEPLLQRVVQEVSRHQRIEGDLDDSPIFQSDASSALLSTSLQSSTAIDQQVEAARENSETERLSMRQLLRAAGPMAAIALLPALLLVVDRALVQGVLPSAFLLLIALIVFVIGLLEWPVVALSATTLDEMSGDGEEGNRPFYLYPFTQLPRLIPLGFALLAALLGIPALPILLWLAAIGWSFVLAAGLWSALYDWRGSQLLLGGVVPVVFQLLVLLAYLFIR
ncbi:MAG: hypothetical protein H7Z42_05015 [Roseiflexaceae bacterium]|nr:hypothetical protein [Roseiflexaceae bacterium]